MNFSQISSWLLVPNMIKNWACLVNFNRYWTLHFKKGKNANIMRLFTGYNWDNPIQHSTDEPTTVSWISTIKKIQKMFMNWYRIS